MDEKLLKVSKAFNPSLLYVSENLSALSGLWYGFDGE